MLSLVCLLMLLFLNGKAIERDILDFHFNENLSLSDQLKSHLAAKGLPSTSSHITQQTLTQRLDHFNESDDRTWNQHFLSNLHNDKGYGINFLRIGGESALLETELLDDGFQMMVWTKHFGAAAFALEHRFYGRSQPFKNLSLSNLQYLNVGQALADIAFFIEHINRKKKLTDAKWVVFGGSYSGNLAAWFRQQYPDLAVGAVASSAPLQATLDFPGYLQVVERAFERYAPVECLFDIKKYHLQSQKLLLLNKSCDSDFTEKDAQHFSHNILGSLVMSVQRDTPSHSRLKSRCLEIKKKLEETQIEAHKKSSAVPNYCSGYKDYVQQHTNVSNCSYYTDFCVDVFGKEINENSMSAHIQKTNELYGGAKNFNASQVVFSNGGIDPWHQLSVYKRPNIYVKSFFIEGRRFFEALQKIF